MQRIDALFYVQDLRQNDNGPYSPLASARFRQIEPAYALSDMGHKVGFLSGGASPKDWQNIKNLVVGKMFYVDLVGIVESAKDAGVNIVVDVCDDWHGKTYESAMIGLFNVADQFTACTKGLAAMVEETTGKPCKVIPDCVEGGKLPVKTSKGKKLGWFGHASNMEGIRTKLFPVLQDFELYACTNDIEKHAPLFGVKAKYLEWSRENQDDLFLECDAALLTYKAWCNWKSPNRIMTALWAGLPTISEDIGHDEWREYTYLGEIADGIAAYYNDRRYADRVEAAQDYIEHHYTAQAVSKQWAEVICGA